MKNFKKLLALSFALFLVTGCTKVDPSTSSETSSEEVSSEEVSSEEVSSEEESSEESKTAQEIISDLIANSESHEASVVSNTITTSSVYSWGPGETTNTEIEYGQNQNGKLLKRTTVGSSDNVVEYFYHTEEKAIEGYKFDNNTEQYGKVFPQEDDFNGYRFTSGIINPEFDEVRGALAAVNQIVTFGLLNQNHDLVLEMVDNYTFEIEFGYAAGTAPWMSYYYSEAVVAFDSTSGAIKSISSTLYRAESSNVVVDDENNTFSIPDFSTCSSNTITYSQTIGTLKDLNFPYYSLSQWRLTSFDVALDEHVISEGETVVIELGSFGLSKELSLVNPNPSTFVADFEEFTVTNGYFNSNSNSFSFFIDTAGTYNVSISSANGHTVSFVLSATAPNPQSIEFGTAKNEGEFWSTGFVPSQLYLGKSINIFAKVNPSSANQETTMTLNGAEITPTGSFSDWTTTYSYYEFNPTELGTYTFVATSTVDSSITGTTTIEVVEAPDYSTLFTGKFYYVNFKADCLQYSIDFVTQATDEVPGSAVFTVYESTVVDGKIQSTPAKTVDYTFTVDKEAGTCTFTPVDSSTVHALHQLKEATFNDEGFLMVTVREAFEEDPDSGYLSTFSYMNEESFKQTGIN